METINWSSSNTADLELHLWKYIDDLRGAFYYCYICTGKVFIDNLDNKYVETKDGNGNLYYFKFDEVEDYALLFSSLKDSGYIFYWRNTIDETCNS